MYAAHLHAFARLDAARPGSLREADIPWPYPNNLVFQTREDSPADLKQKCNEALMRWHSDKFEASFGAKLRKGESERILCRVKAVSQKIIELRRVATS